jgi:hypothetical protein
VRFRRRVIVLEFNELTPSVMQRFIDEGHLPNFARLHNESLRFVTDAEENPPYLEPWIQWVTAHSGLRFSEHGVFNLSDAWQADFDTVWDIVSKLGGPVWVCGSMNVSQRGDLNGWLLPDPWSVNVTPNTGELVPYFNFVRAQVMEYTRSQTKLKTREAIDFIRFMASHGLSRQTIYAICKQLAMERIRPIKWKRATILDRLQFDVFRHGYRRLKPVLSTFFLNSTAHLQHVYWRNMDPQPFATQPGREEQQRYQHAVLYGYQEMDRLVGQVFKMVAGEDTAIVLASALGQQPCTIYDGEGGKSFYKPDSYAAVAKAVGIDLTECSIEPVMSEEFHMRFKTDSAAIAAADLLGRARVNGENVFRLRRNGSSLLTGCAIFQELPQNAVMTTDSGTYLFSSLFYFVDTKKSGMHHQHGICWVRSSPASTIGTSGGIVPLTALAPTLLALIGAPIPDAMHAPALVDGDGKMATPRRHAA